MKVRSVTQTLINS